MNDDHATAYGDSLTELCERSLVTLISGAGFWGRHLYLVGGLVPRYLVPPTSSMPPHVGSRDVDLAIRLAIDHGGPDYETLLRNLHEHGFNPSEVSFRWTRSFDGTEVIVEFLGEDPDVEPGRAFKPRDGTGKDFQALNVPGVRLLPLDHRVVEVEADRLDSGGRTKVSFRVAGLLPFVVLKGLAYADRHKRKDVYDLIHVLRAWPGGPMEAGRGMASSAAWPDPLVADTLADLRDRFSDAARDGPTDYAGFVAVGDDDETLASHRNEAVAVMDQVFGALPRDPA